jgi:hypothetical protein
MTIKNQRDFVFGIASIAFGVSYALGATRYEIGTAAKMGPGYFPLMLGVMMALLGIYIVVTSLVVPVDGEGKIGVWAFRPLFFIIAANFAFGAALVGLPDIRLPAFGMVVGIYVLTFIASLASNEFNIRETFILATILATLSYVGFIAFLKLPFLVWPEFL